MSDEQHIHIHVPKGAIVHIHEDGVEVEPRMSAEQFAELLEEMRKAAPLQIVPMPYPVMPQPIIVPYPMPTWNPPTRYLTAPNTGSPMPPPPYVVWCGTVSASSTDGIAAIN